MWKKKKMYTFTLTPHTQNKCVVSLGSLLVTYCSIYQFYFRFAINFQTIEISITNDFFLVYYKPYLSERLYFRRKKRVTLNKIAREIKGEGGMSTCLWSSMWNTIRIQEISWYNIVTLLQYINSENKDSYNLLEAVKISIAVIFIL